jgi:cell division protein FtsQ
MHQLIDKKNKIIVYILFLLILSTTSSKFVENQNSYSPTINQIDIVGLSKTDNKKILNELNNLFYKNILLIEKTKIQKVISKYNIIEEYNIKKIYPSTIRIKIKPTKFIAKINNNDQLFVGANGKLINDKTNNEILPYVSGEFKARDFLIFKKNIEKSKFTFKELKKLYFFPSSRWDILTNGNILIKLPQDNFLESIDLAYMIISDDEFKNKSLIDLRVNNHLIVK